MRNKYLFAGGVLLLGVGILVYSLQTWFPLAVIVLALACAPQSGLDVGLGPMLLSATPERLMGRVQSLTETSILVASLVAVGLAGYVGEHVPVQIIFAVAGGIIFLAGTIGWKGLAS